MIWEKWELSDRCIGKFYLEEILDNKDALKIVLTSESSAHKITLLFHKVFCLRVMDEGDMLRTLSEVKMLPNWIFYIVKQSSFLNWFHEESYHIRERNNINHYVIATPK